LNATKSTNYEYTCLIQREIQIMSLSKHVNLLPVYGSFVNGSKLYIVTPFLAAGSCLDIIKTAFQEGMDEAIIATVLLQVIAANSGRAGVRLPAQKWVDSS
jgi:serine/threonine protein kinase